MLTRLVVNVEDLNGPILVCNMLMVDIHDDGNQPIAVNFLTAYARLDKCNTSYDQMVGTRTWIASLYSH